MTRVLLIDGGQSDCRIALARDGVIERVESAPGLPRVGRRYDGLRALVAAHAVDVVAAGLTGYAGEELALDAPRVLVTNDAVTAYLGALGDQPGAVIVAGTGAIALAAGDDGWARADGWGTLLGDDGGGYWIGRRALALGGPRRGRPRTGRASCCARARARYGDGPDPRRCTTRRTRRRRSPRSRPTSRRRRTRGRRPRPRSGRTRAESSRGPSRRRSRGWARPRRRGPRRRRRHAAAPAARRGRRLAGRRPAAPVVSWSGGLFAAGALILDPFRAELARLVPGVQPRAPLGDALAGAARLADGTTLFASLVHGVAA